MFRRFVEWVQNGEKSADELLELCLGRIRQADAEIHAWVRVAPQDAPADGRLRGIPFGAKDIIDTQGLPTEWGSPLMAGRQPARDAAVIDELRQRGAILLGKTHTTGFASFDPAPTRNPRLPGHTPGGSSSGSAAAVAAGMAPLAIGTQTLGSVLRPASYCGVCGFKPTFGRIPMDGVMPFAPSLDTLGFFTGTAADMACFWSRSFGAAASGELPPMAWFGEDAPIPFGLQLSSIQAPAGWSGLTAAAMVVNSYEGARTHRELLERHGDAIGLKLAALLRHGLAIPDEEYEAASLQIERMRDVMRRVFDKFPLLVSMAANGPAPEGLESTGDPSPNAPWTALGVPAISIPLPGEGAPIGLQVTAAWGHDDELAAAAETIEQRYLARD